MWALFQKEISGFFSSLTGYVVMIVFLVTCGLFVWVFQGSMNIADSGEASLKPLFEIAPWIFLFLIPAVTMRSFAEEKKAGTLDLLLVRPIKNIQVITAKFLSNYVLVIFAILPTLIYYISVSRLGDPTGNLDKGATWGSYIGLLFLASSYTAIGIFSSSLTENIIVAFLLGVFLCFISYSGFEYIGNLIPLGGSGNAIINIGIDAHYRSVSRGVIDSRDVIYFFSFTAIFFIITNLRLNARRW
jgi:ABC-2 type transport system permease protein